MHIALNENVQQKTQNRELNQPYQKHQIKWISDTFRNLFSVAAGYGCFEILH